LLPIAAGLFTILTVAAIAQYFLSKKSKSQSGGGSQTRSTILRTLVDPNEKYYLPLVEKDVISHDTTRFRFGLPTPEHVLGLPVGQHIHLIATINEEMVIRAYTPVSSDDHKGYVDLVIKVYRRNVHPKFPNGGKMSQFVDELKIGDKIAFRGPTGKLQYLGQSKFSIKRLRKEPPVEVEASTVNMIAGGTGITPMLQLVREVIGHSADNTKLSLLFANQSEDDILLRNELDELAKQHPEQFRVWYTVDTATENWAYSQGFVNAEMIKEHLEPPAQDTITLMCGPPPMINYACIPHLEALGYSDHLRYAY